MFEFTYFKSGHQKLFCNIGNLVQLAKRLNIGKYLCHISWLWLFDEVKLFLPRA